jgi:hypothetical protein
MHQTTVRFGSELWRELERESAALGVSIAQYVREAALARLVHAAAERGEEQFALALDIATGSIDSGDAREAEIARSAIPALSPTQARTASAEQAREDAESESGSAAALWAQSRQARLRARQVREQIQDRRASRS